MGEYDKCFNVVRDHIDIWYTYGSAHMGFN